MLDSVLVWIDKNRRAWLDDLKQWLSIASVSADPQHAADTAAAAEWAMYYLRGAGMQTKLLATPGHPSVLAVTPEGLYPPGAPHVLFYGHYDVQPPEPLDKWLSPPFSPAQRDGRLFARGASDDKGQVFCHMAALVAWKQIAMQIPVRLTVLLEGEEEIGSIHLRSVLEAEREALASASTVIISDSSQFAPGIPAITTGLRGLVYYQITLTGANQDLHSGVYGGGVANPANELCQLLGRLHDASGRVTIPHFYDNIIAVEEAVREQWEKLPFSESDFARGLGLEALRGEPGYSTLERRWCRPTVDINGLTSGYQGAGAKTVLPAVASAKVSMRLVPGQNPAEICANFEAFFRAACPPGVKLSLECLSASPAALTPSDSPAVRAAMAALEIGFGKSPVLMREGGSIPVVNWFKEILGIDSVLVGFGLPDDNLHAPNEKLDLDCLYGGIRTAAALYDKIAGN